jgi:VIT1/CCC1 family predicted Fe2+/Mn2+ transporter
LKSEEIDTIIREEEEHEEKILQMLDEELLQYSGSLVLGLNDALVELTGALAGFTLALRNSKLIALVGLVTGIAASLSMASSEYLSTMAEGVEKSALKASVYTGIAYILTVIILILPYLVISDYFICLFITLLLAVTIIFLFNYYISVAKDLSFKIQFFKMAGLSLGVATLSFFIGFILRTTLGVDV